MKYTILDLDIHRHAGLTGRLIQMPVHVPFGADGVNDIVRVPKSGAYLTADGWLVAVGSELHYEWGPQGRWKVADTSGPLAYAQGVVWLAPRGTRELVGFGVDIEKVARRIPLPAPARALAASGDDLWVLPADRSTILHFKASASFQLSHADIPGTVTALRADAGGLWVGTDGGLLLRVPAAGRSVPKTVARLHHPVAAIALERGRVVVAVR
jgi:hypothetical protein